MVYTIVDCEGKKHKVHTGKPLKQLSRCESGIVLAVQVEDTIELWELFDAEKGSILGVLDVAYADQGIDIVGWAIMRVVAGQSK